MTGIDVRQEELSHTAYFSQPILSLWAEGKRIVQGLYEAFEPFGVKLGDMRTDGINPFDQTITVPLGLNGVHRFRFDRIETSFFNFSEEEYARLPAILHASMDWIRAAAPEARISSHRFSHTTHSMLEGETIQALLGRIGPKAPQAGGVQMGHGAIFHWEVPTRGWTTQLFVDRSLALPDGLFLMFYLTVAADKIDCEALAREGRGYLLEVLEELGIHYPD